MRRKLTWKHHVSAAGVLLVAAAALAVAAGVFGGHQKYHGPSCAPRSVRCEQTSDGYWVPGWYFAGLVLAQNKTLGGVTSGVPSALGAQPTNSQLVQAGATPSQVSDADSSDAAGGEDSGDDDGDDGADDGGGDGGGDGG